MMRGFSSSQRFTVIAFIFAILFSYQNCSKSQFNTIDSASTLSASDFSVGSSESPVIEEIGPKECPQYNQPICAEGYIAQTVLDENSCPKPACVLDTTTENQCPQYNQPICNSNEQVVIKTRENGCKYPICEEVEKYICPQYNQLICAEGYIAQTILDENNCSKPICVIDPNAPVICPIYMLPICGGGSKVIFTKNSAGCEVPSCETNSLVCPQYNQVICQTGYHAENIQNEKGCLQPTCVADTNSNLDCPIYPLPQCVGGGIVQFIDPYNKCKVPSCTNN